MALSSEIWDRLRLRVLPTTPDTRELAELFERQHFVLEQQLGLEIEPWRQAEIGVRRPREAVHATMLATPIGIDGAVERHVG